MGNFVCKHVCNRGSDSSDALDAALGHTVLVKSTGLLGKVVASDCSSSPLKVCYYSNIGKLVWLGASDVEFISPTEVMNLLDKEAHAENGLAKALAEASRRRSEADAAAVDYLAEMDAAEELAAIDLRELASQVGDLRQMVAKMRDDAAQPQVKAAVQDGEEAKSDNLIIDLYAKGATGSAESTCITPRARKNDEGTCITPVACTKVEGILNIGATAGRNGDATLKEPAKAGVLQIGSDVLVKNNSIAGVIIEHHEDDDLLPFKVKMADGTCDWFKAEFLEAHSLSSYVNSRVQGA